MASTYKIGQYRKIPPSPTDLNPSYTVTPPKLTGVLSSGGDAPTDSDFRDIFFALPNLSIDTGLSTGTDYHIKVEVEQSPVYSYVFDVMLVQYEDSDVKVGTKTQYLRRIEVLRSTEQQTDIKKDIVYYDDGSENGVVSFLYDEKAEQEQTQSYPYIKNDVLYYSATNTTTNFSRSTVTASWKGGSAEATVQSFEFIIRPGLSGFNAIGLKMERTEDDYSMTTGRYHGRVINTGQNAKSKCTVTALTNIVGTGITGTSALERIGVWGHPGLMMAINGEEIRVGQSGHYELSAIPVTSLCFYYTENTGMFSVDYQYVPTT